MNPTTMITRWLIHLAIEKSGASAAPMLRVAIPALRTIFWSGCNPKPHNTSGWHDQEEDDLGDNGEMDEDGAVVAISTDSASDSGPAAMAFMPKMLWPRSCSFGARYTMERWRGASAPKKPR